MEIISKFFEKIVLFFAATRSILIVGGVLYGYFGLLYLIKPFPFSWRSWLQYHLLFYI